MKSFKHFLLETSEISTEPGKLVGDDGVRFVTDGGYIEIKHKNMVHAPRSQSVVDFVVDENKRGQGIGKKLLAHALSKYPDLGGQVSSAASLKVFYSLGFRNPSNPEGTLADYEKQRQEDSSIFMAVNDASGKKYVNK
jgi:GNAT superfamily N-acetyltransferase